jgi:hypothetical protein
MAPSVVQATGLAPAAYSGVLTVTLGSSTTAGNCLVVVIWGPEFGGSNPTGVSSVTLGGSAGNFAQIYTVGTYADNGVAYVWGDANCAGGQTSVVVTMAGGTAGDTPVFAFVYEVSGLVSTTAGLLDKSAGTPAGNTSGNTGAVTSGATATTTQASEIWIGGFAAQWSSATTFTGPSSPWVNGTQIGLSNVPVSGQFCAMLSGYDIVSATGAATYAGTQTLTTGQYMAWVVTLKASSAQSVALTAPNVALAALLPSPAADGTVALTAPNVALAAPLVTPLASDVVSLTTPNIALAAPLPSISAGATVALTTPNVALAAPLVTPLAGDAIALTAPGITLAAPLVSVQAGATVALTTPNVQLAAPAVTPAASGSATVNLTAPGIALAAPLLDPPGFTPAGVQSAIEDYTHRMRLRRRRWM